jgi:hypothetical protein
MAFFVNFLFRYLVKKLLRLTAFRIGPIMYQYILVENIILISVLKYSLIFSSHVRLCLPSGQLRCGFSSKIMCTFLNFHVRHVRATLVSTFAQSITLILLGEAKSWVQICSNTVFW